MGSGSFIDLCEHPIPFTDPKRVVPNLFQGDSVKHYGRPKCGK